MDLLYNLLPALSVANIEFSIDILNHKYVKNGVLFHCYENNVVNAVHKVFNHHDIWMSTAKIGNDSSYQLSPFFHGKSAVILNTECEGWASVLDKGSLSFQNYTVIVITDRLDTTTDILSHYPVQVDCDLTVAHKVDSRFILYEVYNTGFHCNGTYNVIRVGYWNSSSSFFIKETDRKDLQGLKMRIAATVLTMTKVVNETVEQFLDKARPKLDKVHSVKYYILLKYMRDMYNMSFDLLRAGSWGYQRNGTFDGMIGALNRGMADIGGAPCFFRIDRAENIHYISQVWNSRHSFVFRHPKHPGGFYLIYTRPLSNTVWYCAIALLTMTGLVTWIMLRMQSNHVKGQDSSLSLACLVIWGSMCQQSMYIRRESTSVKVVTFISFVYAVTLYQYYNATIVSSLLMEPPRNIKTLKDLLESDLKVGADDIVYNKDYFKRTTDPVAQELYRRKVHTSTSYNFFKADEALELVKRGGFAIHIDTAVAFPIIKDTFVEKEICDTTLVQMYPKQRCGGVMRKNAPYKEYICYGIRRMQEAGLLRRIELEIDTPMPECAHTPDASIFNVNILEFSTPLIALTVGIIFSISIFIGEVLLSRVENRVKNRDRVTSLLTE